jgi:hypothetical protein
VRLTIEPTTAKGMGVSLAVITRMEGKGVVITQFWVIPQNSFFSKNQKIKK